MTRIFLGMQPICMFDNYMKLYLQKLWKLTQIFSTIKLEKKKETKKHYVLFLNFPGMWLYFVSLPIGVMQYPSSPLIQHDTEYLQLA